MLKVSSLVVTALAAVLAVPTASADQYIKGQIGQVNSTVGDDSCELLEFIAADAGVNSSCDDSDMGLRVAYGFSFNQHFALEAGYNDFGATEAKAYDSGDYMKINQEVTGFDISAVGRLPIGDSFALVGRAGALVWDADAKLSSTFGESGSESSSGTSLLLGVGAEYALFDAGKLTFDYDYAKDVGDEDETGEGKLARFSAGFKFSF